MQASRYTFVLLLGLFLILTLIQLKAHSQQPKVPHLHNEMTTEKLKRFQETVARQAKTFPDYYFLEALDDDKEVALTFDDGPEATYTAQVLDLLKEYNVKATFFLVGSGMERYPDVVKRIQAEGHAVGNHSYNHPDLRTLTKEGAYDQLWRTGRIFRKLLGYEPAFYRPPYGAVTDEQIPYFASKGYRTVNWSIDSFDWDTTQNSVQEITERVLRYAHEGAIILMHTGGKDKTNTVKSLPIIIKALREQGYTFKTVPDMLRVPAKKS